jgi:hypothetical protein
VEAPVGEKRTTTEVRRAGAPMMRNMRVVSVAGMRLRFVESRQNADGFRKFFTARVARER